MPQPDDTLTLEVAGTTFTGWQDVRIVRGIEIFPSSFQLKLTERLPDKSKLFAISPGQTCRVKIGDDLVITGFIDSYESKLSANGHEVIVTGRSATQDLVDADAGVTPGKETQHMLTFSAPTLLKLAQDLCSPFGISVTEPNGEGKPLVSVGDGIPATTMPLGTKVYDVLEQQAQLRQMLLIDGTDGNLVLDKVGTKKAASGVSLPGSALEALVRFSKQDRFTVYLPVAQAVDSAFEVSNGTANYYEPLRDDVSFAGQPRFDGQERFRPHFVISPQIVDGIQLAEDLARWERARRYGRSQVLSAVVSLWRDSAGTLWSPNTLAPVDIPLMKLLGLTWIISQVVFMKGAQSGTRTLLTLMPPEAFQPQPSFLFAFDPQIEQARQQSLEQIRRDDQAGRAVGSAEQG